jgi:hypothetical protein
MRARRKRAVLAWIPISRQFTDRSLAQRDGAAESIRLHDLQLDYVRAQYAGKEALALIRDAVRLFVACD